MDVRNALRWKGNQRRIQVVEIRVLISIIGSPMFGAWFRHFYRHLQWAKIWAAWLVLFQTVAVCYLLPYISLSVRQDKFLIRTFESQGSGPAPVLASNINFQGICQNLFLEKLRMLQRTNCCSFCDIFGKPEGWTKSPPTLIGLACEFEMAWPNEMPKILIFFAFDEMHSPIQASSSRWARQECTINIHRQISPPIGRPWVRSCNVRNWLDCARNLEGCYENVVSAWRNCTVEDERSKERHTSIRNVGSSFPSSSTLFYKVLLPHLPDRLLSSFGRYMTLD